MIRLFKKHPFAILFSVLIITFSAPGQTFLISIYIYEMFTKLNIPLSKFALIYSLATIFASILLSVSGSIFDRFPPKKSIPIITISMSIGCFITSTANSLWSMFLAILILRYCGQGLFLMASSTTTSKYFDQNRGKALGLMTLGFPLSELIYPIFAIFLMQFGGWRFSYLIFGLTTLCVITPLLMWLIKRAKFPSTPPFLDEITANKTTQGLRKHFLLKEVIKDPIFYLLLLASCIPPVVMTGLFFHQTLLFQYHNWPLNTIAMGISVYAIAKIVTSLITGPIVDKHGPLIPFISLILFIGLGAYIASLGGPIIMMLTYFILMGAALGISAPTLNVVWANLYGTKYFGEIKGVIAMFRNGLTALGPLPPAIAMEMGVSLPNILSVTAFSIILMAALPFLAYKFNPRLNQRAF